MRKLITSIVVLCAWAMLGATTHFQSTQAAASFCVQQKGANIVFQVPSDNTHVVADVYALSGKHIVKVLDKIVSHGTYSFSPFAGYNLTRQTYLIRLSNGVRNAFVTMTNVGNESGSGLRLALSSSASLAKVESANTVVSGVVTDAINNTPLYQVKVSLDSVNYVFTGVDGKFTINVGNLVSNLTHPRYLFFENLGYVTAARYINPDSQQTSVQLHQIVLNNPAITNSDMAITPFGLRSKSRGFQIKQGHFLDNKGRQMREIDASGNVVRSFGFTTNAPTPPPPPAVEWVTAAYWYNSYSPTYAVKQFTASWTVPSAPSTNHDQLIYLFNGIEPTAMDAILQPVLQWGFSPAGGGYYWAVASWYVYNGGYYYGNLIQVSPGDPLVGDIIARRQVYGWYCYDCLFDGVGGSSLSVSYIPELTINCMALEAYNSAGTTCPDYCTDYPADGYTYFDEVSILTDMYNPTYRSLTWTGTSSTDPPCNTYCSFRARVWSNDNPNGTVELYY
jgi:hypothetical protein